MSDGDSEFDQTAIEQDIDKPLRKGEDAGKNKIKDQALGSSIEDSDDDSSSPWSDELYQTSLAALDKKDATKESTDKKDFVEEKKQVVETKAAPFSPPGIGIREFLVLNTIGLFQAPAAADPTDDQMKKFIIELEHPDIPNIKYGFTVEQLIELEKQRRSGKLQDVIDPQTGRTLLRKNIIELALAESICKCLGPKIKELINSENAMVESFSKHPAGHKDKNGNSDAGQISMIVFKDGPGKKIPDYSAILAPSKDLDPSKDEGKYREYFIRRYLEARRIYSQGQRDGLEASLQQLEQSKNALAVSKQQSEEQSKEQSKEQNLNTAPEKYAAIIADCKTEAEALLGMKMIVVQQLKDSGINLTNANADNVKVALNKITTDLETALTANPAAARFKDKCVNAGKDMVTDFSGTKKTTETYFAELDKQLHDEDNRLHPVTDNGLIATVLSGLGYAKDGVGYIMTHPVLPVNTPAWTYAGLWAFATPFIAKNLDNLLNKAAGPLNKINKSGQVVPSWRGYGLRAASHVTTKPATLLTYELPKYILDRQVTARRREIWRNDNRVTNDTRFWPAMRVAAQWVNKPLLPRLGQFSLGGLLQPVRDLGNLAQEFDKPKREQENAAKARGPQAEVDALIDRALRKCWKGGKPESKPNQNNEASWLRFVDTLEEEYKKGHYQDWFTDEAQKQYDALLVVQDGSSKVTLREYVKSGKYPGNPESYFTAPTTEAGAKATRAFERSVGERLTSIAESAEDDKTKYKRAIEFLEGEETKVKKAEQDVHGNPPGQPGDHKEVEPKRYRTLIEQIKVFQKPAARISFAEFHKELCKPEAQAHDAVKVEPVRLPKAIERFIDKVNKLSPDDLAKEAKLQEFCKEAIQTTIDEAIRSGGVDLNAKAGITGTIASKGGGRGAGQGSSRIAIAPSERTHLFLDQLIDTPNPKNPRVSRNAATTNQMLFALAGIRRESKDDKEGNAESIDEIGAAVRKATTKVAATTTDLVRGDPKDVDNMSGIPAKDITLRDCIEQASVDWKAELAGYSKPDKEKPAPKSDGPKNQEAVPSDTIARHTLVRPGEVFARQQPDLADVIEKNWTNIAKLKIAGQDLLLERTFTRHADAGREADSKTPADRADFLAVLSEEATEMGDAIEADPSLKSTREGRELAKIFKGTVAAYRAHINSGKEVSPAEFKAAITEARPSPTRSGAADAPASHTESRAETFNIVNTEKIDTYAQEGHERYFKQGQADGLPMFGDTEGWRALDYQAGQDYRLLNESNGDPEKMEALQQVQRYYQEQYQLALTRNQIIKDVSDDLGRAGGVNPLDGSDPADYAAVRQKVQEKVDLMDLGVAKDQLQAFCNQIIEQPELSPREAIRQLNSNQSPAVVYAKMYDPAGIKRDELIQQVQNELADQNFYSTNHYLEPGEKHFEAVRKNLKDKIDKFIPKNEEEEIIKKRLQKFCTDLTAEPDMTPEQKIIKLHQGTPGDMVTNNHPSAAQLKVQEYIWQNKVERADKGSDVNPYLDNQNMRDKVALHFEEEANKITDPALANLKTKLQTIATNIKNSSNETVYTALAREADLSINSADDHRNRDIVLRSILDTTPGKTITLTKQGFEKDGSPHPLSELAVVEMFEKEIEHKIAKTKSTDKERKEQLNKDLKVIKEMKDAVENRNTLVSDTAKQQIRDYFGARWTNDISEIRDFHDGKRGGKGAVFLIFGQHLTEFVLSVF